MARDIAWNKRIKIKKRRELLLKTAREFKQMHILQLKQLQWINLRAILLSTQKLRFNMLYACK